MTSFNKDKETKEDFCPSCLTVPLAFAGVGAGTISSQSGGKYRQYRKNLMCFSVASLFVAVCIYVYYNFFKDCKKCKRN